MLQEPKVHDVIVIPNFDWEDQAYPAYTRMLF